MLDHIGIRLFRAARAWKAEFDAAMVAAGYPWFTEARSNLLGHIHPDGSRQAAVVSAMGLSKQAIQQLVDELVAEGVLVREVDPADARGRILRYTPEGKAVLEAADAVKRRIDARYRAVLGDDGYGRLADLLEAIAREQPRARTDGST